METNSTLIATSRYVVGGQTEVNAERLEWWERADLPIDETDVRYTVERRTEGRLDLIAEVLLGDTRLWWLIAQYNALLDPFGEVVEGRILRVPTRQRVQTMLTGKLGGFASTREVPTNRIVPIV